MARRTARSMQLSDEESRLFHAYVPLAKSFARRLAGELRADRDEALSECLIALVRVVKAWNPSRGSIKAYARIAFDRAVRRTKRDGRAIKVPETFFGGDMSGENRRRALRALGASALDADGMDRCLIDPGAEDPADVALRTDELRLVDEWLSRLPTRTRLILKARKGRGLTLKTVASCLGMSCNNVHLIEHKVMSRLRQRAARLERGRP